MRFVPKLVALTMAAGVQAATGAGGVPAADPDRRPNMLLVLADDYSWPYAGAYGCQFVRTPALDRIAREGVLFTNAMAASSSCSPSRAAILTSRHVWQLDEAGVHGSIFPDTYPVYPQLLHEAGYHVGCSGKGWDPGRAERPFTTGPGYDVEGESAVQAFRRFLEQRKAGQPFCFWYGSNRPHRPWPLARRARHYVADGGTGAWSRLHAPIEVPPFLPDRDVVRRELTGYVRLIERFDEELTWIMAVLERSGELDKTIVVVTADHGMPFPRAKMQLYEYSIHVPLAVRWGDQVAGGRRVDDPVSLIDLAPTFLEAAGVAVPASMSGRSLRDLLDAEGSGRLDPGRTHVLAGKERHAIARPRREGYPIRGLRTDRFLYLRNLHPERSPSGDPPYYLDMRHWGDERTAALIVKGRGDEELRRYFDLNTAPRPAEELYDVVADPGCLDNLADDEAFDEIRVGLAARLDAELRAQEDPRVRGGGEVFDRAPVASPRQLVHPTTGKVLFPDSPEATTRPGGSGRD